MQNCVGVNFLKLFQLEESKCANNAKLPITLPSDKCKKIYITLILCTICTMKFI